MDSDPHPRRNSLAAFYGEIKRRKVRQRFAIYFSAALTTLGVTNLFSSVYHLPAIVFDAILAVLLCGFPPALVSAWFHGSEGSQRFRASEVTVYALCLVLAIALVVRITTTPGIRLLPADAKSVAVLPFVNLSDSKDDEYFSDGVTEDIIAQLSKIADLKVISRTSTMQYRNTTKSVREIGEELRVAHVLEGSIRRANGRVRIVSQLIDARNDNHIWAETYDKDLSDVFAIQSEVSRSIAHALQASLSPEELKRIDRHPTENLDAYAYYLRGREHYYRYTKDDNERAIELFRKALDVDPRYALAYAGIGDAYGLRATRYGFGSEWADSAAAVSKFSLDLDPNLAEGYKALGLALETMGKTGDALQQYYKAVDLNPNYAPVLANIGSVNYTLGRYDEALAWVRKAVSLQPGSAHYHTLVGLQYFSLGIDTAATPWLSRALSLQPEMVFPVILLTYVDLYGGNTSAARTRISHLLRAHPDEVAIIDAAGDVELVGGDYDHALPLYADACKRAGEVSPSSVKLAFVHARLGKMALANRIVGEILSTMDTTETNYAEGSRIPYFLAETYAVKKQPERSARWLEQAIRSGYRDYRWASVDPLLEDVRNTPAGREAIALLKDRYEAMRARVLATETTR
jgi:TolB-like protein/Flp pilus assembly protein TadD